MANLLSTLEQLREKLERFRKDGLKETPTRTIFIDPILEALDWDVRDPDEVQLEYPTVDGKSVDYALKINRQPVLLVEAKALNDSLADVKDITQTTSYASNDGIVWCILTNGVRWQVYRSIEQCPAPEKLLFEVSYDSHGNEGLSIAQIAEQLRRFSRDEMAKGTLDSIGEQTFTDGKVRKALLSLVLSPPSAMLKLIRNASEDPSLKPLVVKESLQRVLLPILGPSTLPMSKPSTASKRKASARKVADTRKKQGARLYDEAYHTAARPREVIALYQRLVQICSTFQPGKITKDYLAKYVAFKDGKRQFCCAHLLQGGLRIWLKLKYVHLHEPPSFVRDVSSVGHWGTGDVELTITSQEQMKLAEPLIRQSFEQA